MDTIQATPIFDRMVEARIENEDNNPINDAVSVTAFLQGQSHRVIRTWE